MDNEATSPSGSAPPGTLSKPAPPWIRWGRGLAFAGALMVVCFAALAASADLEQVNRALDDFDWIWFWAALGLSLGNFLIRGLRWHLYLRRVAPHVSVLESITVSFAGLSMTVSPGKAGEILKAFMLKWSADVGVAETTPLVVAERISDLIALVLLAAWGALLLPHGQWIALCCVLGCVALLLVSVVEPLGAALVQRVVRFRVLSKKADRIESAYRALLDSTSPAVAAVATPLSLAAWLLQVVGLLCIARGLGLPDVPLQGAALIYCAPLILGVASLLPGGIGAAEVGMAGLVPLVVPNISAANVAVLVILVRTATLWWAVLVGIVATLVHRSVWGWNRH